MSKTDFEQIQAKNAVFLSHKKIETQSTLKLLHISYLYFHLL